MSSLVIHHDVNRIIGRYTLNTPQGPFRVTTEIPLAPIRHMVKRLMKQALAENGDAIVGFSFSDITRGIETAVRKVARSKAIRDIGAKIRSIANLPGVREGLQFATTIFPPLGVSYKAVAIASDTIDKAKAGDPEAKVKVATIVRESKAGDPDYMKAHAVMNQIYAAKEKGQNQIGGWWFNVPYPSVLQASYTDLDGPPAALRELFRGGIDAMRERYSKS